jgi:hypothetical protein
MRIKHFIPIILFLGSLFFINSCATIFSGTQERVNVKSEPPGAKVYLNGQYTARKTPCHIRVPRRIEGDKNIQKYVLKKEGYKEVRINDAASMNGTTLLNLLIAPPGILVDWATGSIFKYNKRVYAVLEKDEENLTESRPEGFDRESVKSSLTSDVDHNIPEIRRKYKNRFALIIGNEDYSSYQKDLTAEINVRFARNDAIAFKMYAEKVLGIPEKNVILLTDATLGQMSQALSKISLISKNMNGKAELFFYYAGHGLPHEETKEPYLIPVDVSGKNLEAAVKLDKVYNKLTEYPVKRVSVFLDACFSGGAREQGLVAARGVKIQPRSAGVKGNMIVFSATSGKQTALPYREKNHGFFTYFLLKKLQSCKGDITYQELADYMKKKVSIESVLLNDKEQIPHVNVSPSVYDNWENWKLNY